MGGWKREKKERERKRKGGSKKRGGGGREREKREGGNEGERGKREKEIDMPNRDFSKASIINLTCLERAIYTQSCSLNS